MSDLGAIFCSFNATKNQTKQQSLQNDIEGQTNTLIDITAVQISSKTTFCFDFLKALVRLNKVFQDDWVFQFEALKIYKSVIS